MVIKEHLNVSWPCCYDSAGLFIAEIYFLCFLVVAVVACNPINYTKVSVMINYLRLQIGKCPDHFMSSPHVSVLCPRNSALGSRHVKLHTLFSTPQWGTNVLGTEQVWTSTCICISHVWRIWNVQHYCWKMWKFITTIYTYKNKLTSSLCVICPTTMWEPSFSNEPNLGPYMWTKRTCLGAFLPEHDKMRGYCNIARSTPALVISVLSGGHRTQIPGSILKMLAARDLEIKSNYAKCLIIITFMGAVKLIIWHANWQRSPAVHFPRSHHSASNVNGRHFIV